MTCILTILNNTFIGTLLAGVVLALFGLFLYRRQKQIDIKYEDLKIIRESASLLFANIEIASKNYEGQLNIYDGKNPQIKLLSDAINKKFENHFQNEYDKQLNTLSTKITSLSDDLVAKLKIHSPEYDSEIKIITDKILTIIIFLAGSMVLRKSTNDEVAEFRIGFTETSGAIKEVLQKLIKQKI